MANAHNILTFIAAEAITEFAIVSIDAAGKVVITDSETDAKAVGVAQRACESGEPVDVVIHGVTRVIAGEPLTFSSTPLLAATLNGRVQACEAGDTTFYQLARVLPNTHQVSASAGDQIKVLFVGPTTLNT